MAKRILKTRAERRQKLAEVASAAQSVIDEQGTRNVECHVKGDKLVVSLRNRVVPRGSSTD